MCHIYRKKDFKGGTGKVAPFPFTFLMQVQTVMHRSDIQPQNASSVEKKNPCDENVTESFPR